ncbi:hypothetical protein HDU76_006777 [Blyttiomyces sp. JEL0837]|nr:hypothetical protein HDU76_006777 [Blyttiomyces sp. JEL0837]
MIFNTVFLAAFSAIAMAAPILQTATVDPLSGFKICSKAADPLTITNISYTPIAAGQNTTITMSGTLTAPVVNGSTIHITAKVGFITAYDKIIDICSQPSATCPYGVGPQNLSFVFSVPSNIPTVTADVKAVGTAPDGTEIACIENTSFKV